MIKNIADSQWTVSNIFGPFLIDLLLKIWEIYKQAEAEVVPSSSSVKAKLCLVKLLLEIKQSFSSDF